MPDAETLSPPHADAANGMNGGNGAHGPRERRFLAQMAAGEKVSEPFVIQNVQLKTNKRGEPYLTMRVVDKSGGVTGNWWDRGEAMYRRLPNPGVVRVKGTVEEFNGNPQLKIDNILQIRDLHTVDYAELIPSTDKNIGAMFAELTAMLRGLQSPTLRAIAEAYLADDVLMNNLRRAPAAQTFHHAFLGGLLEHTLNAMRAADALARLYPGLNRELCVLGVFVHDLAKTWELSYETAFDYTDGGRLVGHVVKGAMWVEEKARAAEANGTPIARDVVDTLQHIVLSHHGELSLGFGSAKSPATPEAIFVHHVENLDAKMTMALTATRWGGGGNTNDDDGRWTAYNKALGDRLFRPDVVAEADAALSARMDDAGLEQTPPTPGDLPALFENE